jgi:hypothetical protein
MTAMIPAFTVETVAMDRKALDRNTLAYRLVGLAVATVLPALFWVALAVSLGHAAGVTFSALALTLVGGAITLFLSAVCAPIILKAS